MTNVKEIKVWDPVVRLFHWSLVLAYGLAYVTGELESRLHEWAGYGVLVLIAVRLIWGYIGTTHARFRDFVFGPRTVLTYTVDLLRGQARRYLGHNPLGGWMVVALLASLLLSGITGVAALYPGLVGRAMAPLATADANGKDDDDHDGEREADEWLGELHEAISEFTLVLVAAHVFGVLISSLVHRENLVRAMFTGRKRA